MNALKNLLWLGVAGLVLALVTIAEAVSGERFRPSKGSHNWGDKAMRFGSALPCC